MCSIIQCPPKRWKATAKSSFSVTKFIRRIYTLRTRNHTSNQQEHETLSNSMDACVTQVFVTTRPVACHASATCDVPVMLAINLQAATWPWTRTRSCFNIYWCIMKTWPHAVIHSLRTDHFGLVFNTLVSRVGGTLGWHSIRNTLVTMYRTGCE